MAGKKRATKKPSSTKAKADKSPKKYNSPVDEDGKSLFISHHLPAIAKFKRAVADASANLRNAYKTAKKDGFLKPDFDVAFLLKKAEGEKLKRAQIARELTVAKWLGSDLGAQLDLFVAGEQVDSTDRAYEEGERASMENQPALPDYHPSTPQYDAFMQGFHDHQEQMINKGIKKPAPKAKAQAAKPKGKAPKTTPEDRHATPPSSGIAMTRSQWAAQQAAAQADVTDVAEVTIREGTLFSKKQA